MNKDNMKYAVQAIILNGFNEVLCVSRKEDHTSFGCPGGKVDPEDTSLEDALAREVKEETGLDVDTSSFIQVFSMHKDGYMGYTYFIANWNGIINTDEPHVVKWGVFDDLKNGTFGEWNTLVAESLTNMGIKFK